jgi:spoIIIJ-associated protein
VEWIEITGRTVAEAVDVALDELGVDEDELEYEVLEEPRRGFLGRMSGGARIRARVKPVSREKPDRRRRRERGDTGGGPSTAAPPRPPAPPPPATQRSATADGPEGDGAGVERQAPPRGPTGDARRRRKRRRRPSAGTGGAGTTTVVGANGEEQDVTGTDVPLAVQMDVAESFTRGLVTAFGIDAEVAARSRDDDVLVEITGGPLGLLIGHRGATLEAIQELVRTAVQRRTGGHGARVMVDVAGYRAKRHEALAAFARKAAERARTSGRDQVFEPMAPADRKVIHDTVNELEGVVTVSEGEEPRRRVVIRAV